MPATSVLVTLDLCGYHEMAGTATSMKTGTEPTYWNHVLTCVFTKRAHHNPQPPLRLVPTPSTAPLGVLSTIGSCCRRGQAVEKCEKQPVPTPLCVCLDFCHVGVHDRIPVQCSDQSGGRQAQYRPGTCPPIVTFRVLPEAPCSNPTPSESIAEPWAPPRPHRHTRRPYIFIYMKWPLRTKTTD
jgi:hypothetical protein